MSNSSTYYGIVRLYLGEPYIKARDFKWIQYSVFKQKKHSTHAFILPDKTIHPGQFLWKSYYLRILVKILSPTILFVMIHGYIIIIIIIFIILSLSLLLLSSYYHNYYNHYYLMVKFQDWWYIAKIDVIVFNCVAEIGIGHMITLCINNAMSFWHLDEDALHV